MNILAIDPGNEHSAFVLYDTDLREIGEKGKVPNAELLDYIDECLDTRAADACVVEMVASYGMAVGREVFETVYWIGRFVERWDAGGVKSAERIFRLQVKQHLCHDSRAKDANIRAALIDRFGPGKEAAIGKKATPGPLFGVSADVWSALAIAVTYSDTHTNTTEEAKRG